MKKKSSEVQFSNLIGIEIGNTGIGMAQINDDSTDMVFKKYEKEVISEGKITEPEAVSEMLKDMLEENSFTGKKAAVVISEQSSIFKKVTMPVITVSQLELNLPYEFYDFVGENAEQYIYDYAVDEIIYDEDGKPETMELFAAAGLKETISQYDEILKNAGLNLVLALPREMALINLFKLCKEKDYDFGECAVIDIGYNLTRIYVFDGTAIKASRILEIGCVDIDRVISECYDVDLYIASVYRESNYENVVDSFICKEVYGKIALEIMKMMNFYRYENSETEIVDVYFSGSGAGIENLKEDILSSIHCNGHYAEELVPYRIGDVELVEKCLMAMAVSTQKGRY